MNGVCAAQRGGCRTNLLRGDRNAELRQPSVLEALTRVLLLGSRAELDEYGPVLQRRGEIGTAGGRALDAPAARQASFESGNGLVRECFACVLLFCDHHKDEYIRQFFCFCNLASFAKK